MNSLCTTPLTVISTHGEDIETQCAQAISSFSCISVKNMMCACYSAVESFRSPKRRVANACIENEQNTSVDCELM